MFSEAGASHHVPDFHACFQDQAAVFSISPVELIAGVGRSTSGRIADRLESAPLRSRRRTHPTAKIVFSRLWNIRQAASAISRSSLHSRSASLLMTRQPGLSTSDPSCAANCTDPFATRLYSIKSLWTLRLILSYGRTAPTLIPPHCTIGPIARPLLSRWCPVGTLSAPEIPPPRWFQAKRALSSSAFNIRFSCPDVEPHDKADLFGRGLLKGASTT